ncbi:LacI family DNA-binding transcriptional regulator [Gryllotalpicola ginsengisoli]|uniref:LacI family DNA-binding transcriptional regulator n=1 Tax=Gryllotalpicola ginsengisoli TaxID=444608 RepID=UPI0003B43983|nr:LacI family DNA-binding transcriptional regulator [Gryllotalpicola ginsengisoli]
MTEVDHRPTLASVAARAGVSASTASLAFSGTGPVSDSTRERVLQAAKELGYAGPDPRARSLRRGRSGIVGVVIEERVREAFRDPIKIATLDGISEEIGAVDAGLLVLTDVVDTAADAEKNPVTLMNAPLDAAVLMGCSPRFEESIAILRSRGVPVVAIEGDPGSGEVLQILQDNREATRRGAEHLKALGHERVAIVALSLDREHRRARVTPERVAAGENATTVERLRGAWDVYPEAPAVTSGGSYVEEGRLAARELLAVPASDRPTAIIAQSDLLAAGVIRAAEELGIAVPEELSVIGFDGVKVDGLWPYDLTTLVQPAVEKGRAAGRAIVAMLAGDEARTQLFTSEFHEGNTTAPAAR